MTITVYIPTPFRSLAGNRSYVEAEGCTGEELLDDLGARYPALRNLLGGDGDEVPAHINIYVNSHEIHTLQGKATPLKDGDDTDKGEYPQHEHPQTEYPRAQKDRHDHDRHLPDENHKALLAVREDKRVIFLEDQRDDAQDGKI